MGNGLRAALEELQVVRALFVNQPDNGAQPPVRGCLRDRRPRLRRELTQGGRWVPQPGRLGRGTKLEVRIARPGQRTSTEQRAADVCPAATRATDDALRRPFERGAGR